jgi:glycerol uptake facilitator protein
MQERPAGAAAQPQRKNSDWSYAWVPVLGPLVGGALAGLIAHLVL